MRAIPLTAAHLPDGTYVELVRSLFTALTPTTIMSILFVVVGQLAVQRNADAPLALLVAAGTAASLVRVATVLGNAARAARPERRAAQIAERAFAATYLAFAVILGLFAARTVLVSDEEVQTVAAALIVGYAAGAAAGASLRPWIGVTAVFAAIVPTVLAAASTGDAAHVVLAAVLASLLAGGVGSMLARYRSEVEKIGMRHTFASLARTDHLTGLANRLSLTEAYDAAVAEGGLASIAVHCLDLDRFKPVNDKYGHPAGDALLQQVGARLAAVLRRGDVAARLGGDEFVLLQTGLRHPGEAELLARRVVRTLGEEYLVAGVAIRVGVSAGYALPPEGGRSLGELLDCADRALYAVKHTGGGAAGNAGNLLPPRPAPQDEPLIRTPSSGS